MPLPQIPEKCQSTLIPSPSASSTDSDDELTGTDTHLPTSTTLGVLSPDSPPNCSPAEVNSLLLPIPPPDPTMPSFILTPLPIPMSSLRLSLSTPPPHYSPELRPLLTPEVFRHLRPQFLLKVEHIPAVGGEEVQEGREAEDEDTEQENRIPKSDDAPPMLRLRGPTPVLTPMMQLIARVSALCADWSAISPNIAHSTCSLPQPTKVSPHCTEGLIRAQTLCRMIVIMTMNHTTISEENVEEVAQEYDRDAQLLFVRADPQKAQLLSVEEQLAMGWQPPSDFPPTPRLGTIDSMPDTSYDYDMELYGDGES
uniref:Reverse transcriptase-rnase h-integrase n=1 Tax=Moniliophthora roreri TaxID=221103 RepID=A0A0W0FER9_MONRR